MMTSVNFYQTTRRYNPEDSHLNTRRRENHRSYKETLYFHELWVYVFGTNNQKVMSHFYLYHEGQAKKESNEICFLLLDCIINHVSETVKELHFFPRQLSWSKQIMLLSDFLQHYLLIGDSTKPFGISLSEDAVTGTSDLLTKFYTKEVGCIHEKSTAN
jgi:hypothetical protein